MFAQTAEQPNHRTAEHRRRRTAERPRRRAAKLDRANNKICKCFSRTYGTAEFQTRTALLAENFGTYGADSRDRRRARKRYGATKANKIPPRSNCVNSGRPHLGVTVAILAQGTTRAVAVTQAFLANERVRFCLGWEVLTPWGKSHWVLGIEIQVCFDTMCSEGAPRCQQGSKLCACLSQCQSAYHCPCIYPLSLLFGAQQEDRAMPSCCSVIDIVCAPREDAKLTGGSLCASVTLRGWVMECQGLQYILHGMWRVHPYQADSLQGHHNVNCEVLAADDPGIGSGW